MAGGFVMRVGQLLQRIEHVMLNCLFRNGYPPEGLCVAATETCQLDQIQKVPFSVRDLFGDGFLWAVPKKRRSIEKRLSRKYGDPKYFYKVLLPKKNILVCNACGHHYEAGHLCGKPEEQSIEHLSFVHCYAKVKEETQAMQDAIQTELGLNPIEQEVVVLYDGEKQEAPPEFWKGKRIVEMKKERPSWFSKNLLQKSTVQPSTSTDIKPNELG